VIVFWLICLAMLIVALMSVLPPALRAEASKSKDENARRNANIAIYRDQLAELEADLRNGIVSQEQYAQDRDDLERRLLEDTTTETATKKPIALAAGARKHAYMMGIGLALVAVIFYLRVGSPDAITTAAATGGMAATVPAGRSGAPAERSQAQIEAQVAALTKRLQSNPSDAQGWTMLARSYSSMERFGEATGAYAKATELTPDNADLWAEYAMATAMAGGRKLEGKPTELIERALKIDPNNLKALGLAGSAAYDAKNYQKAIDYWQRVLKQMPPNPEATQIITARINEAKEKLAGGSQAK
jgi:cytochrome c-type biogenesis protein CcmH